VIQGKAVEIHVIFSIASKDVIRNIGRCAGEQLMSPRSGQKEGDITNSFSSEESPSLEGWCVQMKSVLTKADPLSRSSTILVEDRFAPRRRSPLLVDDVADRSTWAGLGRQRLRGDYDEDEDDDLDVADDDDDDDDDDFDEDFDEFDDDFDEEDDDLDDDFDDEED